MSSCCLASEHLSTLLLLVQVFQRFLPGRFVHGMRTLRPSGATTMAGLQSAVATPPLLSLRSAGALCCQVGAKSRLCLLSGTVVMHTI